MQVAHTADLTATQLAAARALVFEVFDDATEDDWEHCLGGIHAIVWEGDRMAAHGSVIQRRLIYKGRALRTGYVEGVAVRADRRRRGLGAAVMAELERVIRAAYVLGGLGASDEGIPFYLARGWQRWQGPSYRLTPEGTYRTADDDDAIFVLPVSESLDPRADLICDFRQGEPW
ncbi:MAG TPA: GNAT family N-acetyltransferase [Candidatus Dormibacteraeota bacterium]|nr:GNAT family N-acetyltransferase [Candidatus Dormibacteraeota bacterium]